jgi:hypothetical protein
MKKERKRPTSLPPQNWNDGESEKDRFERMTGQGYNTEANTETSLLTEVDALNRKQSLDIAMNAAADKFHAEVLEEKKKNSRVGGSRTRRRIKRLVRQANRKRACTQRRRRRKSSRLPLALSIAHELYRPRKHRRHGTRMRHRSTKHHHHGTRIHRHH